MCVSGISKPVVLFFSGTSSLCFSRDAVRPKYRRDQAAFSGIGMLAPSPSIIQPASVAYLPIASLVPTTPLTSLSSPSNLVPALYASSHHSASSTLTPSPSAASSASPPTSASSKSLLVKTIGPASLRAQTWNSLSDKVISKQASTPKESILLDLW